MELTDDASSAASSAAAAAAAVAHAQTASAPVAVPRPAVVLPPAASAAGAFTTVGRGGEVGDWARTLYCRDDQTASGHGVSVYLHAFQSGAVRKTRVMTALSDSHEAPGFELCMATQIFVTTTVSQTAGCQSQSATGHAESAQLQGELSEYTCLNIIMCGSAADNSTTTQHGANVKYGRKALVLKVHVRTQDSISICVTLKRTRNVHWTRCCALNKCTARLHCRWGRQQQPCHRCSRASAHLHHAARWQATRTAGGSANCYLWMMSRSVMGVCTRA